MDFSSSFKNSFKSHKHGRRISAGSVTEDDAKYENQPILSDHRRESSDSASHNHMPGSSEVIVKIDGGSDRPAATTTLGDKNIWRESSLEFWGEGGDGAMQKGGFSFGEEPSVKLIGQFLNKQKAAGGETSLDMDLEMDELRHGNQSNNKTGPLNCSSFKDQNNRFDEYRSYPTSKELRVSFQDHQDSGGINVVDIGPDEQRSSRKNNGSSSDDDENLNHRRVNRRRSMNVANNFENGGGDEGQVLRCTSVQRRVTNLGRLKTRSRLMDPPEIPDRRSGILKSGQIRSGILGRASGMITMPRDDEEEDPLFDEDLPDEYKKAKFDALTIAQWISLILIVTALVCTLVISKWKRKKLRGLSLWKWEMLILVLICGRLVSGWGIRVAVFFVERNFFMRKRVLYFVYGVRKAVQNCIWLGLVLISWHYMLDQKVEGNNEFLLYVNKLMICMLVGTSLWLAKTLMVKVLASSFHVSTFFDRIQETLFNQYVIETLSGPPLIEMQCRQEEEERTMAEVLRLQNAGATLPPELRTPSFLPLKSEKFTSNLQGGLPPKPIKGASFKISGQTPKNQEDKGLSIDKLHKLNNKNVSAWNMKRLMNTVKHGVLSTLDEQVLDSSQGDEAATQIKSEYEAKVAARKIFRNVAKPGAKFIYPIDLMRFLREEEALKTLNVIEGSTEIEKITKASLKSWVVNAFRERKALALTLNDTKTAVNKLHQIVNVVVGIIIFVICLVILEIATSKFLLFISSQIVVVAFIFGNTCKTVFEAVIFVFVMHPFDVGDRCEIDGVQMIVEEMNILTTVFLRFDNQKILYPNVTLATKPISNYYRSPDMGDSVDFAVHIATPVEKIAVIKQRITSYIENKSEHWYPSPTVVMMNLEDLHRLKLSVWMRHRMNHQDMGERWNRRALFVEEMVKIFKELDIQYRLYPVDINIRAMPPLNSNRIPSTWPPPALN
ncbi:mechanosensitive ion channel protein 6-like [Primulina huaijiensis]|uniref:mechanosensitive ion channel protein 6-like n=1 Tax=Primulina huaijiensis TaxID=1492673 RepID=UPI003CC77AB3